MLTILKPQSRQIIGVIILFMCSRSVLMIYSEGITMCQTCTQTIKKRTQNKHHTRVIVATRNATSQQQPYRVAMTSKALAIGNRGMI